MMKDMIISEKGRKKEGELVGENVDKITLADVVETSNPVDFNGKYMQIISNIDIDVVQDLRLISIKKYQRCTS